MPDATQNPNLGWTGGQYSVWRAGLAVVVAGVWLQAFAQGQCAGGLLLGGLVAVLGLAVGLFDRLAAALSVLLGGIMIVEFGAFDFSAVLITFCLVGHLVTPPGPFGSLAARGRDRPGGGWAMPPSVVVSAWSLVVVLAALLGFVLWQQGRVYLAVALLAYGPAALLAPVRPWAWAAMFALMCFAASYELATGRLAAIELGVVWVHLLTADPAWLKPKPARRAEWLFYDGRCGLCHGAVRFVLAEDRAGDAFRFAPIGGQAFERELAPAQRRSLPDSVVLLTEHGDVLTRSRAVAHLLSRLGGLWRVCAWLLCAAPRPLRDKAYDLLAKLRRRLFKTPPDTCPVADPDLRQRFEL